MPKKNGTKAEFSYVSSKLLDFDPNNPRFGAALTGASQEEIQRLLVGPPHFASELIDSLTENGFIDYEPLVVKKSDRDRFTVVEGNRRLAAIREIQSHPEKYSGGRTNDLEEVPVLIFPEKAGEQQKNEMRVYLGVRHLLGFREWPPLSKAEYLHRESTAGGLDRVLAETRLSRTQARRFLVPFRLLSIAKLKLPPDEDFWVLGEALGRAGIKKFLQLEVDPRDLEVLSYDKKNLKVLLDDLYGPETKQGVRNAALKLVEDTRDLSRLARVLGSDKATAALRVSQNLDEAEIHVDTREESIVRLSKVTKELRVLIKKISKGSKDESYLALTQSFKQFDAAVTVVSKKSS